MRCRQTGFRNFRKAILWCCFLGLFGTSLTYGQQDTLYLVNEDRIIGDIKEMIDGVLIVDSDYGEEEFKLNWLHVKVFKSDQNFLLTLDDGARLNAKMSTPDGDPGRITLVTAEETRVIRMEKIVYLRPVESNLISRFEAALSVGFNFTKSNNLQQLSVIGVLSYSASAWAGDASINTISSTQKGAEGTQRTDATLGAVYFLKKDWFTELYGEFLSNDEQQLNLRFTLRGVGGKYMIHSNRMYLKWSAGLAMNNETFSDDENTKRTSLEGVLGMRFNSFDFGDFKIFASVFLYPSITESNRFRADFRTDMKYDLPKDFFIKLGYTLNFDSQPVENAAKEDYIFQATFGWEFD